MAESILVDLHRQPRQAYRFLWADYVELLTLCSQDGRFSRGNFEESEQEGGDLQVAEDETVETESEELDDAISQRWEDIKPLLNFRSKKFAYWPFELKGNVLHRRFDPNNPGHRIYAALLIGSSLRLCHNKRDNEVSAALEELTYLIMVRMLGDGWIVKPFGAHQTIAEGYAGTLFAKLKALAIDVHARLMKEEDDYAPQDTGDGGLDVVAWNPLGDNRGHMPVIFAQCGCSPTDWEHKQYSVTTAAIEAHISPQHPAAAWYISPQDLCASDHKWNRAAHIAKVVLLDRRRLLHLVKQYKVDNQHIPAWDFTAEAATLKHKLTA